MLILILLIFFAFERLYISIGVQQIKAFEQIFNAPMNRGQMTIQDETSRPTTIVKDTIVSLKDATRWLDLVIKNLLMVGPGPDQGYPNMPLSLSINESPRLYLNIRQSYNI
jgi:hypothetical protein